MNRVQEMIRQKGRPLIGAAAHSFNPVYVELMGLLGYDVLWIEMEHLSMSYEKAANLCCIASGMGMLSMIRVSDTRRENVLKAAECGPDIIDIPMSNSPEPLRELVANARYAPDGSRGFFVCSRALRYGLHDIPGEQKRINREICLMGQVETVEAVECVDELCRVPGVDAILIGPGDLSASMGYLGNPSQPEVREAMRSVVSTAKSHGKLVALPPPASEAGYWAKQGVDILFCVAEIGIVRNGLRSNIEQVLEGLEK